MRKKGLRRSQPLFFVFSRPSSVVIWDGKCASGGNKIFCIQQYRDDVGNGGLLSSKFYLSHDGERVANKDHNDGISKGGDDTND